jgi:hypothetical protein
VDAGEALRQLKRRSTAIRRAAITDADGAVLASAGGGDAVDLEHAARTLLDTASGLDRGATSVDRVEVHLPEGWLFVLRSARHVAAATTGPEPLAPLVVHDLRGCLTALAPKPARRRTSRAETPDA